MRIFYDRSQKESWSEKTLTNRRMPFRLSIVLKIGGGMPKILSNGNTIGLVNCQQTGLQLYFIMSASH